MDKKLLFLLFLLFHLYLGTVCQAQQEISVGMPAAGDDTARVEFYFRQGYSTFSPSFRNNESALILYWSVWLCFLVIRLGACA